MTAATGRFPLLDRMRAIRAKQDEDNAARLVEQRAASKRALLDAAYCYAADLRGLGVELAAEDFEVRVDAEGNLRGVDIKNQLPAPFQLLYTRVEEGDYRTRDRLWFVGPCLKCGDDAQMEVPYPTYLADMFDDPNLPTRLAANCWNCQNEREQAREAKRAAAPAQSDRPIWPTFNEQSGDTAMQVAHNLACIADRLESLQGAIERRPA